MLTFNLLFAISGALSTSLQSIIFIASLTLPGAVIMKTLVQGKHNHSSFCPKQAGTRQVGEEGGARSAEGDLVWEDSRVAGLTGREEEQLNAGHPRGQPSVQSSHSPTFCPTGLSVGEMCPALQIGMLQSREDSVACSSASEHCPLP